LEFEHLLTTILSCNQRDTYSKSSFIDYKRMNSMASNDIKNPEIENEKELVYLAVFEQIKECRDIISSLLIIYEFIREENISTTFNPSELRQFALSAAHNKTSTHLWHINALIATAVNFNDLLIGIEMCFDGWLGNKQSFIKHKYKQQSLNKLPSTTTSKQTIIPKSEITSFVTSYYQPSINDDEQQQENKTDDREMEDFDDNDINNNQREMVQINDENENQQNMNMNINAKNDDENNNKEFEREEFMKSYRGKISSPISFRMRQQKRMKQKERRQNSSRHKFMTNPNQNQSRNTSVDLDFENNDESFQKQLNFQQFDNDNNDNNKYQRSISNEPNILSPFNVSKFAKRVDLIPNDMDSPQFHRKNI